MAPTKPRSRKSSDFQFSSEPEEETYWKEGISYRTLLTSEIRSSLVRVIPFITAIVVIISTVMTTSVLVIWKDTGVATVKLAKFPASGGVFPADKSRPTTVLGKFDFCAVTQFDWQSAGIVQERPSTPEGQGCSLTVSTERNWEFQAGVRMSCGVTCLGHDK
jgi:hypothetical protein